MGWARGEEASARGGVHLDKKDVQAGTSGATHGRMEQTRRHVEAARTRRAQTKSWRGGHAPTHTSRSGHPPGQETTPMSSPPRLYERQWAADTRPCTQISQLGAASAKIADRQPHDTRDRGNANKKKQQKKNRQQQEEHFGMRHGTSLRCRAPRLMWHRDAPLFLFVAAALFSRPARLFVWLHAEERREDHDPPPTRDAPCRPGAAAKLHGWLTARLEDHPWLHADG